MNAYYLAKDSIKRTEFILSLIDDEEEKEKIKFKHNELTAFCEKVEPMIHAAEMAAAPYIEFLKAEKVKLSS